MNGFWSAEEIMLRVTQKVAMDATVAIVSSAQRMHADHSAADLRMKAQKARHDHQVTLYESRVSGE